MRIPLFAFVLVLAACSEHDGPPVVADNIVVTAPAAGMSMAAAYLDITNQSGTTIRISSVTSPNFELVEMHETTIEDGVARMREIPALEIEDGVTVSFERGGKHLMLMRPLDSPDIVTLNFHSGDMLLLSVSAQFTAMTD